MLTRPDGTAIMVDEVAWVSDGFVDGWRIGRGADKHGEGGAGSESKDVFAG